ncbi:hypothetical protein [Haloterrigena alkaliphila]|uniref:Uncharacterized protein n=1 Tax=Haloterrigena alkaliphila TaxID=2816475 RepID=A0A8A2V8A0_9EURY|nr:hypothetical protein [Haloterrigena alkaliphila]QSW98113.1 hypothetical protein J0X25_11900 [Haloterrigena alkaliphila]
MIRRFASRFRNEIDRADVVSAVLFAVVLSLFGHESTAIGVLAGLLIGVPFVTALFEATELDLGPGLAECLFGAFAVAAGINSYWNGSHWLGLAFGIAGAWLVLDGIDTRRHGDVADTSKDDDMLTDELHLYGEYNRWLVEELRTADRPLTADEIQSRTGLTEDDFERLLEIHGESGPIERVGTGYTIDERELGAVAFVRNLVRTIGGRLLRPFRLFRPAG